MRLTIGLGIFFISFFFGYPAYAEEALNEEMLACYPNAETVGMLDSMIVEKKHHYSVGLVSEDDRKKLSLGKQEVIKTPDEWLISSNVRFNLVGLKINRIDIFACRGGGECSGYNLYPAESYSLVKERMRELLLRRDLVRKNAIDEHIKTILMKKNKRIIIHCMTAG